MVGRSYSVVRKDPAPIPDLDQWSVPLEEALEQEVEVQIRDRITHRRESAKRTLGWVMVNQPSILEQLFNDADPGTLLFYKLYLVYNAAEDEVKKAQHKKNMRVQQRTLRALANKRGQRFRISLPQEICEAIDNLPHLPPAA